MAYFKYQSTKRINEFRNHPGKPVWQRNYYEHIIRNEKALGRIQEYILTNPERWCYDKENQEKIGCDEFDVWLNSQGQLAVH